MKKGICFMKKMIAAVAMIPALAVAGIRSAHAATLGSIASSASSDLVNVGKLIEYGAYIIGFVFVLAGFMKLAQTSNQPGAPKGPALMMIIIGVALLGIGAIIMATSGTFGDSGASSGLGKLGIGG